MMNMKVILNEPRCPFPLLMRSVLTPEYVTELFVIRYCRWQHMLMRWFFMHHTLGAGSIIRPRTSLEIDMQHSMSFLKLWSNVSVFIYPAVFRQKLIKLKMLKIYNIWWICRPLHKCLSVIILWDHMNIWNSNWYFGQLTFHLDWHEYLFIRRMLHMPSTKISITFFFTNIASYQISDFYLPWNCVLDRAGGCLIRKHFVEKISLKIIITQLEIMNARRNLPGWPLQLWSTS